MNLQRIEQGISHIEAEASFIFKIDNDNEHEQALALMEQLIEDYEKHEPLIDLLCISIEKYEDTAEEFKAFNANLKQITPGVAALSILIDQHKLKLDDLKDEIGGKSLVSMILNEKRPLNLNHIRKLAERFHVPPQLFI
jgi:HTH-type transcriptional regulator/antitoxin HigA